MGPASKTSLKTSSRRIGEVDAVVSFKPKKMVKEEMTGGQREQGRNEKKPVPSLLFNAANLSQTILESSYWSLFYYFKCAID